MIRKALCWMAFLGAVGGGVTFPMRWERTAAIFELFVFCCLMLYFWTWLASPDALQDVEMRIRSSQKAGLSTSTYRGGSDRHDDSCGEETCSTADSMASDNESCKDITNDAHV